MEIIPDLHSISAGTNQDMDRHERLIRTLRRIRLLRLLKQREQERNRQRRLWVRPVLAVRDEQGEFSTLVEQLRADPDGHHKYFRMLPADFDFLLQLVKDDIEKETTTMRRPIPPGERLALTLR